MSTDNLLCGPAMSDNGYRSKQPKTNDLEHNPSSLTLEPVCTSLISLIPVSENRNSESGARGVQPFIVHSNSPELREARVPKSPLRLIVGRRWQSMDYYTDLLKCGHESPFHFKEFGFDDFGHLQALPIKAKYRRCQICKKENHVNHCANDSNANHADQSGKAVNQESQPSGTIGDRRRSPAPAGRPAGSREAGGRSGGSTQEPRLLAETPYNQQGQSRGEEPVGHLPIGHGTDRPAANLYDSCRDFLKRPA